MRKYVGVLPMRPGQCQALTKKRRPCPSQSRQGSRFCGIHVRQWLHGSPLTSNRAAHLLKERS